MNSKANPSNESTPRVCRHCGEAHIQPGTPESEFRQMDACRERELLDIQAEQQAWWHEMND
ncbi:MAG: hypothetical protein ACE5JO_05760 [Candidatus Binatia bacterium]